jgi:uncharacterized membrane protein YhaH (DUF805 family)
MTDPTPPADWSSAPTPPTPPPAQPTIAAGWYPDPGDASAQRYWDGTAWTEHVAPGVVQPVAVAPVQAVAAAPVQAVAAAPIQQWAPAAPTGASFGFGQSVKRAFARWKDYSGRATVSEFWWFYLFTFIASMVLYIPIIIAIIAVVPSSISIDENGNATSTGSLNAGASGVAIAMFAVVGIGYLVLFLVTLALAVRRLHDTDRSGLWYLISFIPFGGLVLLYFFVLPSTPGPNQYGPPST